MTYPLLKQILFCSTILISSPALAYGLPLQDDEEISDQPIEEVIVTSARRRALEAGMLADTIQQTEMLSANILSDRQAVTLSDALVFSPGIRVNNECSMCGVKRIMLNGLSGHHTTILLDGQPAHTMVSGFYGPDAMTVAGVERIEIARGAGASLIAPEAIGGSINVVTTEPTETAFEFNASAGLDGYKQGSVIGYYVSESGATRITLAGQYADEHQQDGDENGVSESPALENKNITFRISQDFGQDTTLTLRAGYISSEIFGGPVLDDIGRSIQDVLEGYDGIASPSLFVGDDVRNKFIGKPWETSEWISTERREIATTLFTSFTDEINAELSLSFSEHKQDSFYEGIDYKADNDMYYADLKVNYRLSDQHLFTVGASIRDEKLRSDSVEMSSLPTYISDSFDYVTKGLYVQDIWNATDNLEIAIAIRFDHVKADFTSPLKPGTEIDNKLISPRIDMRYQHNDYFTSRLSGGRGYRAPLSFFETDHGILDAGLGFAIEVSELEKSLSASYALSYSGDVFNATASVAHTAVENLAALSVAENGIPTLTQLTENGHVTALTFEAGWTLTEEFKLNFTGETFFYDDIMRSMYGIAPVEERFLLGFSWEHEKWNLRFDGVWTGPRDLQAYGYEGYNDIAQTSVKPLTSPSYITLDARLEYQVSDGFSVFVGGKNLTNYTQVNNSDTPLFYNADGAYDVAYIYGPLHGREIYGGLSARF